MVVHGAGAGLDFGKTFGIGINGAIFGVSVFADEVGSRTVRKWLLFIHSLNSFILATQQISRTQSSLILHYPLITSPGPGKNFSSGLIYENFSATSREHPKLRPLSLPMGERSWYLLEGGLSVFFSVKSDFLP